MIIPSKVEEKIRYLLRKFPSTEWSGVLFTKYTGSFENNDLVIICEDIYPMDLGNATFTDFSMSADVTAYMANNIELFDCDLQLVHSHHSMSTTPSGTDLNTLREEGNERNCFVSLIVNNAGTYSAAITRKVKTKSEITVKTLGRSYEFFGEGAVTAKDSKTQAEKEVVEREVIEYFKLDIERHTVDNPLAYLDDRFTEIQKKKDQNNAFKGFGLRQMPFNSEDKDTLYYEPKSKSKKPIQTSLFSDKSFEQPDDEYVPDPEIVKLHVMKMVVLSLLAKPAENFSFKQWIDTRMENVYNEAFCNSDTMEAVTGISPFESWRDFIVEFMVENFCDANLPVDLLFESTDFYYAIVAKAFYDELAQYKGANDYIDGYLEGLERYF